MKTRINITIEESLLQKAKYYSSKRRVSLSKIISDYLESVIDEKSDEDNLLLLVDSLEKPYFDANRDLKKEYYEAKSNEYEL